MSSILHNQQALKYLQRDDIGKIIAKGLANLYTNKPLRPIKYLAQWLKKYSQNKKQMQKISTSQLTKHTSLKLYQQQKKHHLLQSQQQNKVHKQKLKTISQFKLMIQQHEYQQQLLQQIFPQFIQKNTNITGAYIGELNYPPKVVKQEDTEENSHLNLEAQKVINYVGSSLSHKALMRGKILKLNQGVTGGVFSLNEDQPKSPTNQEQQQDVIKQQKKPYIYIPNVVKSQSIHYFKIPKLGAYLAIPLIYSSYLTQKIFDEILQSKKQQLIQEQQFKKKKIQEIQQFHKNKEELEKKICEIKQKIHDESQLDVVNAELGELVNKIKQKQQEKLELHSPVLTLHKNCYVVCVDNLGKDQQLNKNDIQLIVDLVNHFKNTLQQKQHQLILKDISNQINMLNNLQNTPIMIKQLLQKAVQINEQGMKIFQQIQDEKLQAYKIQQEEVNRMKNEIQSKNIFLLNFLKIKQFRIIKFKQVIQNILFFLKELKKNINLPKKTILNWKHVKQHYITQNTFNNILNYKIQGPKNQQFSFYSKTPLLISIFQKFNQDEIFAYNIGLGALVKYIKKVLKHRVSNVQLRKAQKQIQKQQRDALIEQNTVIQGQKIKVLESHRSNLIGEQLQNFNQVQWLKKYDEEHLKHVPPEIVFDLDKDM